RGSSSRGGREAAAELVKVLRAGYDIGITPDGPRGPRYDFKSGGLIVTRRTRTSVVLLGAAFESAWTLRSWDGFYLPPPFSRVRVYSEYVSASGLAGDREEVRQQLAARLIAISPDAAPPAQPPASAPASRLP